MDARTILIVATLMMLLNGAVLGLMHGGLSVDVQASARDWRIGTLITAGGCVFLAVQDVLPAGITLTAGNASLFLGMTLYWRAVRRFDGLPDRLWLFIPGVLGAFALCWFATISPNFATRVVVATVACAIPLLGAGTLLVKRTPEPAFVSRLVLAALMYLVTALMIARAVYVLYYPARITSSLDSSTLVGGSTPLLLCLVTVVGTTSFLMMCSQRVQRQWQLAATTDFLTGLANRRTISATADSRVHAARRLGLGLVVAIIDIDRFKSVNDRFGHETGDRALQHTARILASHCRDDALIGRIGGEEFVVLLEGASLEDGLLAAERLRCAVELAPILVHGHAVPLTVSIGLSAMIPSDADFNSILRRADRAMYRAKEKGRNCIEKEGEVSAEDHDLQGQRISGTRVA